MTFCKAAAALAAALVLAACGPKVPDYQAIWSTKPSAPAAADTSGLIPFPSYLEKIKVGTEQVVPSSLTDLKVNLPRPQGWTEYKNLNYSPGTVTIADHDSYPMAMLMVFRMSGDFNVDEAIKHADADAMLSQNFKKLDGSTDKFGGFPSSMIEGSYDLNGQRMQSYNRIVIATPNPPKPGIHYLIQLTVTAYAEKAKEQAGEIESIIKGFSVSA